jgi:predicted dehydrogenase
MAGHRVLIIGCGNIAGGFDMARPDDAPPLTHAGAFSRHGGFEIAACIDPNEAQRLPFMTHWNVADGYADAADVPVDVQFDVIAICSPTAFHADHLRFAIQRAPRLIFCEKPITPEALLSRDLVDACAARGILVAVNHLRRWAPDIDQLGQALRAGEWGEVRSLSGVYNKGVLNNGSHMIDLVHQLLGESVSLIAAGPPVWDFWPDDPTVPALLLSDSGIPVQLTTAHAADYALFELTVVTAKGVIVIEDGGGNWRVRMIIDSAEFSGYRQLDSGAFRSGKISEAMAQAIENIDSALVAKQSLKSTGESALLAQMLCDTIKSASLAAFRQSGT